MSGAPVDHLWRLGVGRQYIRALASLFYPDAPNDIAPTPYNDPEPTPGLLRSPPPSTGVAARPRVDPTIITGGVPSTSWETPLFAPCGRELGIDGDC